MEAPIKPFVPSRATPGDLRLEAEHLEELGAALQWAQERGHANWIPQSVRVLSVQKMLREQAKILLRLANRASTQAKSAP